MNKSLVSYDWVWAGLSGLLAAWAFCYFNEWLNLVAMIPLLVVVSQASKLARLGWAFGLAWSVPMFFWMTVSWKRFTGMDGLWGLLPYGIAVLLVSGTVAVLLLLYEKMRFPAQRRHADWLNPLLLASLWTLMEYARLHLLAGYPFLASNTGFPLAADLYAVQPVSVFGFSILTFVTVFVNAGLTQAFVKRQVRLLVLPLAFLGVYWGAGYVLFQNFEKQQAQVAEIKAALICPNFDAEFKWDAANGNWLVKTMLGQYQTALASSPDLVVWTESVVPWTYAPDDPFVLELKRLAAGKKTRNLLGMTTTASPTEFYNSAYLLGPDSTAPVRYDKRLPLSMLESRFWGYQLPFRTLGDMTGKAGTEVQTLPTPQGKAGMMICNESVMPSSAALMANAGADFLVNMSNDAWFADTYIPLQHFYNARVRAVEARRDVVVNSNQGFCGSIAATGKIGLMHRAKTPQLLTATLRNCSIQTLASHFPYWWVSLLVIFSLLFFIYKRLFL